MSTKKPKKVYPLNSFSAQLDNKAKLTNHKYSIAEQQKVYKAEIERIWLAQLKSIGKFGGQKYEAELEKMKAKKAVRFSFNSS
jgi:hypothetical protein